MKVSVSKIMMIALFGILTISACKKDDNSEGSSGGQSEMQVMLTDAPGDYEKVFIDIQAVEANIEGHGWTSIALVRPGIYNLLDFSNGIDTVIAWQRIPAGELKEIRLILGPKNSVVIAGVSYDLTTPSAEQSGLKIKVSESLVADGKYIVWIDFDANKSIVVTGSGKYILKPVLRAFLKYRSGSLKGDVNPDDAALFVNAINNANTDTFTTFTYLGGKFYFLGLPQGAYHVHFYNRAGTDVKSLQNVQISNSGITDLGDINIQ